MDGSSLFSVEIRFGHDGLGQSVSAIPGYEAGFEDHVRPGLRSPDPDSPPAVQAALGTRWVREW
jgi:hypothetical protein